MAGVRILNLLKLKYWRMSGIGIIFFIFLLSFGMVQKATAADKGPIKIGFTAALTGNFARYGQDMVSGFKMYMDEINWSVAGRKVEMVIEDEVNAATAVTKVRKLIHHDKVHMIAGVFLTPATYSLAPLVTQMKVPMIINVSGGDDVTQRKASPYVVRTSMTGCELGHVCGDFAYRKLGWRTAITIAMDVGWGHENAGAFHRVFEDLGGKVIQKQWTPFKAVDYGPFLASANRKADGIFDCVTGAASIRFLKAVRESGKDWQVIGPGPITDTTYLPSLGDDGLGVYSAFQYSMALPLMENILFVERAKKWIKKNVDYCDEPADYFATVYRGARIICEAIEKINGNVEDSLAFMKTLRGIEIDHSIAGPYKIDKYGHSIQNQYIRRVDKFGGKYQNTVVDTYPLASQFFKYNPEKYLAKPIYSRKYPPCKHCK